jgi:hypothetical protein
MLKPQICVSQSSYSRMLYVKIARNVYRNICTSLSRIHLPFRLVSAQYIWCLLLRGGRQWRTRHCVGTRYLTFEPFCTIDWQQLSLQSVQCRDERGEWWSEDNEGSRCGLRESVKKMKCRRQCKSTATQRTQFPTGISHTWSAPILTYLRYKFNLRR